MIKLKGSEYGINPSIDAVRFSDGIVEIIDNKGNILQSFMADDIRRMAPMWSWASYIEGALL